MTVTDVRVAVAIVVISHAVVILYCFILSEVSNTNALVPSSDSCIKREARLKAELSPTLVIVEDRSLAVPMPSW